MTSADLESTRTLEAQVVAFVRAFGLHRPDETPCGRPVSVSEAHALRELAREAPLAQSELGAKLGLEKSTVSRLVGQLEDRGWVTRAPNPGDGRSVVVRLTAVGRRADRQIAAARRAKFERVLERIPEGERSSVHRALDVLVEALRVAG
jgi:DNA-binding MarR family transcriptional regulator